jgi:outer membrane biosynthesis protein TonB
MDRAEQAGLGVALVGHGALLVLLTLAAAATRLPIPRGDPIEVSFLDEAGPTSTAPTPSAAPPAPSVAPEIGTPQEAAPQPAEIVAPRAPAPTPIPTPAPAPAPAASRRPAPPAKAQPTKATPAEASPSRPPASTAKASPPRGSRFGNDFLKGIGRDPSTSRSQAAPAAAMSSEALAGIKSVIERQIQPCADRQRDPGPGANQIKVTLNLRLNRDGSLARDPQVVRTAGVTPENGRYEARVRDLAVAAYVGCSPLHGLPAELFQTPKGGWNNLNMTYHLP